MPKQDWDISKLFNLKPVDSILDVACGLSLKSKYFDAKIRVGVDIFDEYFKHIETDVPYVVVKQDVRNLKDIFLPKSFDLVLACDIIEHLEKDEALQMIKDLEEIARYAVILETPKGFIPQDIDILGFGAHDLQTHKCGWEVEELEEMGYQVKLRDYTMSDKKRHSTLEVNPEIQLIEAIKYV